MANEEKIKKEQAEKDAERAETLSDDAEKKDVDNDGDFDVDVKDVVNAEQLLLDIKELLLLMRDELVSRETTVPVTETEKVEELGTSESMGNADDIEEILGL